MSEDRKSGNSMAICNSHDSVLCLCAVQSLIPTGGSFVSQVQSSLKLILQTPGQLAPTQMASGTKLVGDYGLPPAAHAVVCELIQYDLINRDAIRDFCSRLGAQLSQLFTREKALAALMHDGHLSPFQRDRVAAGATYTLALGPYRVQERINGGTVGVVFRATHISLKRSVALKVLPVDDSVPADAIARFWTEIELLSRISHPNVVGIFDAGTVEPPDRILPTLLYAALELATGGDLEQYVMEHGQQPVPVACEWGRQIATGLNITHAHNLVHRDLKPSNILLTDEHQAKITDFGLARHFASNMTNAGRLLGSVEFMAPEQASDPTTVGPASDVYSLGAILFWVLTGELPYQSTNNIADALSAIRKQPPRRLRDLLSTAPDALDQLIAKMMSRNPANRPTAAVTASELAKFAANPSHPDALAELQNALRVRTAIAHDAADSVLTVMGRVAEFAGEPPSRTQRHQEYVRALATALSRRPNWSIYLDSRAVMEVVRCVPIRNIGMLGLPDAILQKRSGLTFAERAFLDSHVEIGSKILNELAAKHGDALPFLRVARSVVRHHHEKWDGSGFPDDLKGIAIPHAARLIAVAEAYDALRRDMGDIPGLTHSETIAALNDESPGYFDPTVIVVLIEIQKEFEQIFVNKPDVSPT